MSHLIPILIIDDSDGDFRLLEIIREDREYNLSFHQAPSVSKALSFLIEDEAPVITLIMMEFLASRQENINAWQVLTLMFPQMPIFIFTSVDFHEVQKNLPITEEFYCRKCDTIEGWDYQLGRVVTFLRERMQLKVDGTESVLLQQ